MLFFLKHWRESLIVVLVAFLCVVAGRYRTSLIERGKAEARAARADSVLSSQRPALMRVDTLWKRDTVRLVRSIARVDTIRDSVTKHLTDTVLVREYIARTDSALQACSDVQNDCAEFHRLAEERFHAYEAKIAAIRVVQPRSCVASNILSAVAGAAVGRFSLKVKFP